MPNNHIWLIASLRSFEVCQAKTLGSARVYAALRFTNQKHGFSASLRSFEVYQTTNIWLIVSLRNFEVYKAKAFQQKLNSSTTEVVSDDFEVYELSRLTTSPDLPCRPRDAIMSKAQASRTSIPNQRYSFFPTLRGCSKLRKQMTKPQTIQPSVSFDGLTFFNQDPLGC